MPPPCGPAVCNDRPLGPDRPGSPAGSIAGFHIQRLDLPGLGGPLYSLNRIIPVITTPDCNILPIPTRNYGFYASVCDLAGGEITVGSIATLSRHSAAIPIQINEGAPLARCATGPCGKVKHSFRGNQPAQPRLGRRGSVSMTRRRQHTFGGCG